LLARPCASICLALTTALRPGGHSLARALAPCFQFDIAMTMIGAASMALWRRRLPGAPCLPEMECPVGELGQPVAPPNRWREAWYILRTGFVKVRRTASEGIEALKLEAKLYSAAVGRPALVGFQYIVDRCAARREPSEWRRSAF
jgi:hypothetical protein